MSADRADPSESDLTSGDIPFKCGADASAGPVVTSGRGETFEYGEISCPSLSTRGA